MEPQVVNANKKYWLTSAIKNYSLWFGFINNLLPNQKQSNSSIRGLTINNHHMIGKRGGLWVNIMILTFQWRAWWLKHGCTTRQSYTLTWFHFTNFKIGGRTHLVICTHVHGGSTSFRFWNNKTENTWFKWVINNAR